MKISQTAKAYGLDVPDDAGLSLCPFFIVFEPDGMTAKSIHCFGLSNDTGCSGRVQPGRECPDYRKDQQILLNNPRDSAKNTASYSICGA